MHVSIRNIGIFAAALLSCTASAGLAILPRDVVSTTANDFNPWISVNSGGVPVATYTPSVTTTNGVGTTLNPIPWILTATWSLGETTGSGLFLECHNRYSKFAPFCSPKNGSDVFVYGNYYVTWDKDYFGQKNASVNIVAKYVNDTGHGLVAFKSDPVSSSDGFFVWTIQEDWLQELKTNNLTLFLNLINPPPGSQASLAGPTVRVKVYEEPFYSIIPPGQDALYIGLIALGFFVIIVSIDYFITGKYYERLRSVMSRKRGYATGRSKSQRMGGSEGEGGTELREYPNSPSAEATMSSGLETERMVGEGLGSLAGSSTGAGGHNSQG